MASGRFPRLIRTIRSAPAALRTLPRRYYTRYSGTDRYTFLYDSQYNFFTGIYWGIAIPMQKFLAFELGASAPMIGFLAASPFIGLFLNLISAHQASRKPKVKYAVQLLTIARLAPVLMLFVRGPWLFIGVCAVSNVFEFMFGPAYRSMQKINYSDHFRPKIIGETRIILSLLVIASSHVASKVFDIDVFNLRFMYPIASVFGILGVWRLSRVKVRHESEENMARNSIGFRHLFEPLRHNRTFLFLMLALFVVAFGNKIGEPIDPFRKDELGLDYDAINNAVTIAVHVAQIVGMFVWSKLAMKYSPLRLLVFAGALLSARALAFALAGPPIHLADGLVITTEMQLVTGMALYGFGLSGTLLLVMLSIYSISHDDSRIPNYLGLHFFLVGIRGIAGPNIGALLHSAHLSTTTIYFINTSVIFTGVLMLGLINIFARRIARSNRFDRITANYT